MSNIFEQVPLHIWGDDILEKLKALGYEECGIIIAVVDGKSKQVTSTGNMSNDDTADFLCFLAAQHVTGAFEIDENAGSLQ